MKNLGNRTLRSYLKSVFALAAMLMIYIGAVGAQTLKHGKYTMHRLDAEHRAFYRYNTCLVSAVDKNGQPVNQGWQCGMWFIELSYIPR